MFSMSTEGIETFPHLIGKEIIYGPFLPEVFCEYQELGAGDKLLSSHELKLHHEYLLILSDNYGLIRYNTGDIFKVTKIIHGHPNLEFLRRREMTSSLTGEKITEQQVLALFTFLRLNDPSFESVFMTVFPALLNGEAFYVLGVFSFSIPSDVQEKAQDFLANENIEYKEKVESGRLKDLRVKSFDLFSFAKLMKSEDAMESQFKILPLYERPIELDQKFLFDLSLEF
jgi:GH3 auxin-responsive promoter